MRVRVRELDYNYYKQQGSKRKYNQMSKNNINQSNSHPTCSFTSSSAMMEIARPDVPARPTRPTVK